MKTTIGNLTAAIFAAAALQTHAQGTFIYDQQSAASPIVPRGNGWVDGFDIQPYPLTQSFVPALSAIGFVEFEFQDIPGNGSNGATVYVNLWTGSPNINSASLLGSTAPVYMPDGWGNNGSSAGNTDLYFTSPIASTPGQTYYLQPVVSSGDNPWDIMVLTNTYANGQLFSRGNAVQPTSDLWFREGILTPEPSALALAGLASLLILARSGCRKFLPIAVAACAVTLQSARAQAPFSAAQIPSLQRVDPATLGGRSVFWLVKGPYGGGRYPPTPCWPEMLQGLENSLPVYSLGEGFNYLIDDRSVDYEPLLQSQQLNQALSALEAQVPQQRACANGFS